jgi:hypothetical protein
MDTKRSEIFHTFVANGLFLCKRARPDIQQAISVLYTSVKDPNQADWEKLMRVMKYLNGTRSEYLTLSADDLRKVEWWRRETRRLNTAGPTIWLVIFLQSHCKARNSIDSGKIFLVVN